MSELFGRDRGGPMTFPVSAYTIGAIHATADAQILLADSRIQPIHLVARHASGDHGLIDVAMRERNMWAQKDARPFVVSVFEAGNTVIYVVTMQREQRTVLMSPHEYHFWAAGRR